MFLCVALSGLVLQVLSSLALLGGVLGSDQAVYNATIKLKNTNLSSLIVSGLVEEEFRLTLTTYISTPPNAVAALDLVNIFIYLAQNYILIQFDDEPDLDDFKQKTDDTPQLTFLNHSYTIVRLSDDDDDTTTTTTPTATPTTSTTTQASSTSTSQASTMTTSTTTTTTTTTTTSTSTLSTTTSSGGNSTSASSGSSFPLAATAVLSALGAMAGIAVLVVLVIFMLRGRFVKKSPEDGDSQFGMLPVHEAIAMNDLEAVRTLVEGSQDHKETSLNAPSIQDPFISLERRSSLPLPADPSPLLPEDMVEHSALLRQASRSTNPFLDPSLGLFLSEPSTRDLMASFGSGDMLSVRDSTASDPSVGSSDPPLFLNDFMALNEPFPLPLPPMNAEGPRMVLGTVDRQGCSLVSWAARLGTLDILKYLIQKGADACMPNHNGQTPLHVACLAGASDELVTVLVDAGVPLEARDNDGNTALMYCAVGNILHLFVCLHRRGALLNARDPSAMSPLMMAAAYGNNEIVQYILAQSDLDTNLQDQNEWTALHWAVASGSASTVRLLVDSEEGVLIRNNASLDPFQIALNTTDQEVLSVFLSHPRYASRVQKLALNKLHEASSPPSMTTPTSPHTQAFDFHGHPPAISAGVTKLSSPNHGSSSGGSDSKIDSNLHSSSSPSTLPHPPSHPSSADNKATCLSVSRSKKSVVRANPMGVPTENNAEPEEEKHQKWVARVARMRELRKEKKDHQANLTKKVAHLEDENTQLREEMATILKEADLLRQVVDRIYGSVPGNLALHHPQADLQNEPFEFGFHSNLDGVNFIPDSFHNYS